MTQQCSTWQCLAFKSTKTYKKQTKTVRRKVSPSALKHILKGCTANQAKKKKNQVWTNAAWIIFNNCNTVKMTYIRKREVKYKNQVTIVLSHIRCSQLFFLGGFSFIILYFLCGLCVNSLLDIHRNSCSCTYLFGAAPPSAANAEVD